MSTTSTARHAAPAKNATPAVLPDALEAVASSPSRLAGRWPIAGLVAGAPLGRPPGALAHARGRRALRLRRADEGGAELAVRRPGHGAKGRRLEEAAPIGRSLRALVVLPGVVGHGAPLVQV